MRVRIFTLTAAILLALSLGLTAQRVRQDGADASLPAGTGIAKLTSRVFSVLTDSAGIAGSVSDETGSGALAFATSPTFVTPVLGVASATSLNKVVVTAPATSATLTIADGKTATFSHSITFAGTDSTTMTFPGASASIVSGVGLYKIARGTVTLDGSNPSSATTGLAAIVSCALTDKRADTPGDDPIGFTTATAAVAGRLDVYAWKTDGSDPTWVASTDADDTIDWICVGT